MSNPPNPPTLPQVIEQEYRPADIAAIEVQSLNTVEIRLRWGRKHVWIYRSGIGWKLVRKEDST